MPTKGKEVKIGLLTNSTIPVSSRNLIKKEI